MLQGLVSQEEGLDFYPGEGCGQRTSTGALWWLLQGQTLGKGVGARLLEQRQLSYSVLSGCVCPYQHGPATCWGLCMWSGARPCLGTRLHIHLFEPSPGKRVDGAGLKSGCIIDPTPACRR